GDRAAALAVYQRCAQILHDELDIAPDEQTTALADAIRAGELSGVSVMARSGMPVAVEMPLPRPSLPSPLTALIGRQQELTDLRARRARADVRLLTLTGPGGTGKTRLGLQLAAELLDAFADGVYLVTLAPIRDPNLVIETIAAALAVKEGGEHALLTLLKRHIRDRQLLLLLDNFEHLIAGPPLLAELLGAAP